MGKIVYLCGKSASGKDTIFGSLLERNRIPFKTIIPYTTRPKRAGEAEGREYHFTDEVGFQKLLNAGKIVEHRSYDTVYGLWRYFTVDDGQIDLGRENYLVIGTLEGFCSMKAYYGEDKVVPVLITLDDGIRLQRALDRERQQEVPQFQEMCRRFLADCEDFKKEKIQEAGITIQFENNVLEECLEKIESYIRESGIDG